MAENELWRQPYSKAQLAAAVDNIIPSVLDNGNWGVWDIAHMERNDTGMPADANPIVSIERTASQGLVDTYTITFKHGDSWSFQVTNGSNEINIAIIFLPTESWTVDEDGNYEQSVAISGVTRYTKVSLQPDATALQQLANDGVLGLYIDNDEGALTAVSVGGFPTADMTIQVSLMEVTPL